MKHARVAIASGCLFFVAGNLLAQNYYRAEQQARRDSALNDAEQQRIAAEASSGGSAATAGGAPAPTDPVLLATRKNITGLQTDFAAFIADADKPDGGQKVALRNDLTQAAQGGKASVESVKKLAEDLSAALVGQKKLTVPQQTKLAQMVHALFNSSHLSATQQQTVLTNVQKILTDAGVPLDAAVDIVTDLKSVVADTK